MDLAKKALVAFFLMMALCGMSLGAVHKVGDSAGWTARGNVNYNEWASTKNFHVGDSIVFEYNNKFHNVMQVSRRDFLSCNATHPVFTLTSGSDTYTMLSSGHYYFLCGFPGHCQAGQKVEVMVAPAPTPNNGSLPNSKPMLPSSNASSLYLLQVLFNLAIVALCLVFEGIFVN